MTNTLSPLAEPDLDSRVFVEKFPELFHYTDKHSFRSIVATNALWGTDFRDLNDAKEFVEMADPLNQALATIYEPEVEKHAEGHPVAKELVRSEGGVRGAAVKAARTMRDALYKVTFTQAEKDRLLNSFVTSLCTHPKGSYAATNGLLSQWRGYARDGGFCLVFDTEALLDLIKQEQDLYHHWGVGLLEAYYFDGPFSLPPEFAEIGEISKRMIASLLRGENFELGDLFLPFAKSAASIKHQGFREECEVRILAMPATALTDQKMRGEPDFKSRRIKNIFSCNRGSKVKRHISLFGKEYNKLPIKRIIVGPARDTESNATLARKTLDDTVDVKISETPLVS